MKPALLSTILLPLAGLMLVNCASTSQERLENRLERREQRQEKVLDRMDARADSRNERWKKMADWEDEHYNQWLDSTRSTDFRYQ